MVVFYSDTSVVIFQPHSWVLGQELGNEVVVNYVTDRHSGA